MKTERQILDYKQVDLGMFGSVAECRLIEDRRSRTVWHAIIDTGMNRCEGWGDSPEEATRKALEREVINLKTKLAELQLFLQAKGWEAQS